MQLNYTLTQQYAATNQQRGQHSEYFTTQTRRASLDTVGSASNTVSAAASAAFLILTLCEFVHI